MTEDQQIAVSAVCALLDKHGFQVTVNTQPNIVDPAHVDISLRVRGCGDFDLVAMPYNYGLMVEIAQKFWQVDRHVISSGNGMWSLQIEAGRVSDDGGLIDYVQISPTAAIYASTLKRCRELVREFIRTEVDTSALTR